MRVKIGSAGKATHWEPVRLKLSLAPPIAKLAKVERAGAQRYYTRAPKFRTSSLCARVWPTLFPVAPIFRPILVLGLTGSDAPQADEAKASVRFH